MDSNEQRIAYLAHIASLGVDSFEAARTMWKKGITDVMALSRYLAETAATDYHEHGNVQLLQDHLDDLSTTAKNFVRRAPYLTWIEAFYPVRLNLQTKKLEKDRDVEATRSKEDWQLLHEKAMNVPYWDTLPEKAYVPFSAMDVVAAMEAVIKRFTGKKQHPKDDAAMNELAQAQTKVAELRRLVPLEKVIAATPTSNLVSKPAETTPASETDNSEFVTLAEQQASKAA